MVAGETREPGDCRFGIIPRLGVQPFFCQQQGVAAGATGEVESISRSFGKVDAGFHGTLTLSAYNASEKEVEIPIGDRFAQIVFEMLITVSAKTYEKRSGNYQGQRGVNLG